MGGNKLVQNDFINTLCEISSQTSPPRPGRCASEYGAQKIVEPCKTVMAQIRRSRPDVSGALRSNGSDIIPRLSPHSALALHL